MEGTTEKICPNCGERLPNDSFFCVKCGTKIDEDVEIKETSTREPDFIQKNRKKIGIGIIAIIALILVVIIINTVQTFNLKKELKRDWQTVEGEDGSYITCVLDFSDDEIEYKLETGYTWMNTTVATYEYKVISGNKIKALRYGDNWETFTIEFNEDKSMMTVSPALTSVDDKEYWFNLD